MAYQALYRSLRPVVFSDVIGQTAVVETLRNQIRQGRIGHAYLLCGTRGTGKTTIAKIFARAVNCQHPKDGDPCQECETCLALSRESNMDVVEIDAASNNGVDEIRDLRDKIKYPPSLGKYRVYIIDEVHMLSTGAFNALLKTLEEPPAHALFILATTEPQRIPATILSRCQRMDFHRLTVEEIANYLTYAASMANCTIEEEARYTLARAAEGAMRDALSLLDTCISFSQGEITSQSVADILGTMGRDFLFDFADALSQGNTASCLNQIDRVMRDGRDIGVFTREVTQHLRNLLTAFVVKDCALLLQISEQDAQSYRRQAETMGYDRALRALDLFAHCEMELRTVSSQRALLELTALRACEPALQDTLLALKDRVAELEKKFSQVMQGTLVQRLPVQILEQEETEKAMPVTENAPVQSEKAVPLAQEAKEGNDKATEEAFWKNALANLKKKQIRLYGALRRAVFLGIEGKFVRVSFAKADAAFAEMLSRPNDQKAASAVLSETAGRELLLSVAKENGQETLKQEEEPLAQTFQQVFDLFGRENVDVIKK